MSEICCSSCMYLGRGKICSTCSGYELWEESELSKCERKSKLMKELINSLCEVWNPTGEDAQSYQEWALEIKEKLRELDNE